MSQQIVKQPDGMYAIWSTVIDDFVVVDATKEEIIREFMEAERERVAARVNDIIAKLERGEKPYHQFTKTFQRLMELQDQRRLRNGQ